MLGPSRRCLTVLALCAIAAGLSGCAAYDEGYGPAYGGGGYAYGGGYYGGSSYVYAPEYRYGGGGTYRYRHDERHDHDSWRSSHRDRDGDRRQHPAYSGGG